MKYELVLRCRPNPNEPVSIRHEKIVKVLSGLGVQWGVLGLPGVKEPQAGQVEYINLRKYAPKGVVGDLRYASRQNLSDSKSSDDYLVFEFSGKYRGCSELGYNFYASLIRGFSPYYFYIGDYEFTFIDKEVIRNIDARSEIYRFFPVTYFDDLLCKRCFGVGSNEFVVKVSEFIDGFSEIEGGVIFVNSNLLIPLDEAERLNSDVWRAIRMAGINTLPRSPSGGTGSDNLS